MIIDGIDYNETWAKGKTFEQFSEGAKGLIEALHPSKHEAHLKAAYELLNPKPKGRNNGNNNQNAE